MRSIVGQIAWNATKMKAALDRAAKEKIDLVATPELALIGYPCDDLLSFQFILHQEIQALAELAAHTKQTGVALLVGHTEIAESGWFYNCATLFENGERVGTIRKERLPSYNIFNEARQFVSYTEPQKPLLFRGKKLGISICEDAWDEVDAYGSIYPRRYSAPGPALKDERAHCDLHINISASPFEMGKTDLRDEAFVRLTQKLGKPFLWVNRVGGQDEAIFDGQSAVYSPELSLKGSAFDEDFIVWSDHEKLQKLNPAGHQDWAELQEALIMGIRDFVHQSGSQGAIVGLSGGIDSALVATLCAKALGPKNVLGVSLPSAITSDTSKRLAREVAEQNGIEFDEISIEEIVQAAAKSLGLAQSLSFENLQSRARGILLMGLANKNGKLLMACGNKSEYATGYGTLYGDIAGALAPIGDLLKTEVYGLCHFLNRDGMFSEEILDRPPTAELAPNQKDTDSLPHYAQLDAFLHELLQRQGKAFVANDWSKFFKTTSAPELLKKVLGSEFKRFQSPPLLRVSNWAFGRSWSMPIATRIPS